MDNKIIVDREKKNVDGICDKYGYDNNIKHLLYLIIPAFVIRYGINREKLIINTFNNVKIITSDNVDDNVMAYYAGVPYYVGKDIKLNKFIVVNNYQNISIISLLDSLVHEFNHAVNSYNNGVIVNDSNVLVRSGVTYTIYDKRLKIIKKDDSYILEEVINTRQVEEIINIIKKMDISDDIIRNAVYSINNETNIKYESKAYYLESYICNNILVNKTFISTLNNLRLTGDIVDIEYWFDNIIGSKGKYKELISKLNNVMNLEIKISKSCILKKYKIKKLRDLSIDIKNIINTFNNNSNYN